MVAEVENMDVHASLVMQVGDQTSALKRLTKT